VSDVTKEPAGALRAAIKAAAPGDEITYHVGEFAGGLHRTEAYAAYERGEVLLVQRRLEPHKFAFLAIRTRKK
jgi:hypothetical protein